MVIARISIELDANAKFWSFFISESKDVGGYINGIFEAPVTAACALIPIHL